MLPEPHQPDVCRHHPRGGAARPRARLRPRLRHPRRRPGRRRPSPACSSRAASTVCSPPAASLGDAFLRRFANGGYGPVVMLNRRVRGVRPTVTVDDAAGAALAVRSPRASSAMSRSPASSGRAPSTPPAAAAPASRRGQAAPASTRSSIDAPGSTRPPGSAGAERDLPRRIRDDGDLRLDLRHRHGRAPRGASRAGVRIPRRLLADRPPRQRARRLSQPADDDGRACPSTRWRTGRSTLVID